MALADRCDGLHADVPESEYHERIPGLISRTAIKHFQHAPAVYKAWLDGENEDEDSTPALEFGAALHCALLEPPIFAVRYVVEPDFGDCRKTDRTTKEDAKDNKTARDAWRLGAVGKRYLTAADQKAIDGMIATVRAHPYAAKMLVGGSSEITAIWRDEATGLRCKARADYYVGERRLIVDVKTCQDARDSAFARDCAKYGYHLQRALYGDGFAACGFPIENFAFLCIEKKAPYLAKLHMLDIDSTVRGREAVRDAINGMAECLRANEFPGYDPSISTISVPRWG